MEHIARKPVENRRKAPYTSAYSRRRRENFRLCENHTPPGGVGGSPDLSGQALFHTFLSGQKPYVWAQDYSRTRPSQITGERFMMIS